MEIVLINLRNKTCIWDRRCGEKGNENKMKSVAVVQMIQRLIELWALLWMKWQGKKDCVWSAARKRLVTGLRSVHDTPLILLSKYLIKTLQTQRKHKWQQMNGSLNSQCLSQDPISLSLIKCLLPTHGPLICPSVFCPPYPVLQHNCFSY